MDSLQTAKSWKIFKDFVVQGQGLEVRGQGQGLVNSSSRTRTFLEDYNTANNSETLLPLTEVKVRNDVLPNEK